VRALRFHRERCGFTQKHLARLANCCQPAISDIELGRLKPNDELLDRLARVLGVTPAYALLRHIEIKKPSDETSA
jgi:transcriptional regulator with XRE-family HTH domain